MTNLTTKKLVICTTLIFLMIAFFTGLGIHEYLKPNDSERITATVCSNVMLCDAGVTAVEEPGEDVTPGEDDGAVEEPSTDGETEGDETVNAPKQDEGFISMIGDTTIEIFKLKNVSAFNAGIATIAIAGAVVFVALIIILRIA